MRVPKLTRSRFILGGAGVVFFFLLSWKSFFQSGEKLQSRQYVASERKISDNAQMPGWNPKNLDTKIQAMKPKLDTHQDLNIIDLGRPDIDRDNHGRLPSLEDEGRPRQDKKNRLNHKSFLAVPHQEEDDSKSSSKDERPDDKDSSSQSSYVSSQDEQNEEVVVKRENHAKFGLFDDDNFSVPPHFPLNHEEKDKAALATAKSKGGLSEKTIHQPQNAPLIAESPDDGLLRQMQDPPQPPQDAQTLPKSFNSEDWEGRSDVLYKEPTLFAQSIVPKDGMTNSRFSRFKVVQDKAKSSDSVLLNKKHVHYPTTNNFQDELDKQQGQVVPTGVIHEEKTDVVAIAEAGKVFVVSEQLVNSQPPTSHFAQSNNPVYLEDPKLVPTVQRHGGIIDQVAVMHHDKHIPPSPPDMQFNENIVVTKKPIRGRFLKDGELVTLVNVREHLKRENTKVGPDDAPKSIHVGSSNLHRQSNMIFNKPVRDDNTAHRILLKNPPRKITVQERKLVPPNTAQLRSGLEFRQPQKHVSSREIQVNSLPSTGPTRKVVPHEKGSEKEFMLRMETVQRERHDRVRQQCQSRYNLTPLDFHQDRQKILSWKKYYEHAYANDDHQFIICRELKAASFNWRKVMISLYAKGSRQFRRSQKMGDFPMMDYDDETFISKLQKYKKILFVREPFARFLSAYRDKYVELRHFPYYQPIGVYIIKKYRKNPTLAEIQSGRPTFEEFTRWVVAEEVPEGDYHWRPLFNWYHPCEIRYDFIGKVETATEDTKYIFKMIGIDKLETFPSTETYHTSSSSADVLEEFYSQLPLDLLPQLVNRYKEEFELFDYPIPQKMSDIWTKR